MDGTSKSWCSICLSRQQGKVIAFIHTIIHTPCEFLEVSWRQKSWRKKINIQQGKAHHPDIHTTVELLLSLGTSWSSEIHSLVTEAKYTQALWPYLIGTVFQSILVALPSACSGLPTFFLKWGAQDPKWDLVSSHGGGGLPFAPVSLLERERELNRSCGCPCHV